MFRLKKRSKEMCIGHRLINYPGKCQNVHGHGIILEVEVESKDTNEVGMAKIDFDDLKTWFSELDGIWDHGFLVNCFDDSMIEFLRHQRSKYWACPLGNPTMENLAKFAFNHAYALNLPVAVVRVFEKGGNDNVAEYWGSK